MIIIKTFQELAQEMNISRQALYKRYKDKLFEEMSSHISKRGNILFIDAEGEKILKDDFEQSKITPFTTALDNANLNKKLDKILSEIEDLKTEKYQNLFSEIQKLQEEIEVLKIQKPCDNTVLSRDNFQDNSINIDNTVLSKKTIATNEEIIEMLLQNKTSREIQEKLKTSPKRIKKLRDSLKQE